MTEKTGYQPLAESDITPDVLSKASHAQLANLRDTIKDPKKQELIAPYEHRAFAREYVGEGNPLTSVGKAVGLTAAIPAYQAKKAVSQQPGETPASLTQATEALKGVGEGLVEPWKRLWNDGLDTVKKAVETIIPPTKPPVEPSRSPWERSFGVEGTRPLPAPLKEPITDLKTTLKTFTPKLEKIESSGNPEAKNPVSSATGLHQFTSTTWKATVKAMGKDYSLADRTDPAKSREVFQFFTEQNAKKAVADLGRTPQEHELYAYHLLGRSGGGTLLKASANAPASEVVGESKAKKNAGLFYKDPDTKKQPRTVAEVLQVFKEKFK